MDTKVGNVYSTTNYGQFRYLVGNRTDYPARGKGLLSSLKEHGQLVPIIVSKSMEIGDGQARAWALSYLGQPIKYEIVDDLTFEKVLAMNTTARSWSSTNYIESFAEQGIPSYKFLHYLKQQFPLFNYGLLMSVAKKRAVLRYDTVDIRNKTLSISPEEYQAAIPVLNYLVKCQPFLPEGGHTKARYSMVLACCFYMGDINTERMYKAIQLYQYMMKPVAKD